MAVSMKGRIIDMASMVAAHAHVRAVGHGNVRMNARGDRIGAQGQVLKTAEQVEAERLAYNRENPMAVTRAPFSALDADVFDSPAAAYAASKPSKAPQPNVIAAPVKAKKVINDD